MYSVVSLENNLDEGPPLVVEVALGNEVEPLRRGAQLAQDGVLQVVPEHVLVVLVGLLVT